MSRAHTIWVGLSVLAMVSCSSVAPVKISAGDQCFRCRKYVADERAAAETIDTNNFVSKFKGPGCLAKYLVAHPAEKATIYVTDYTTGKMFGPEKAFYVEYIADRQTNEVDYHAYRQKTDADAFAAERKGAILDWNALLDKAH